VLASRESAPTIDKICSPRRTNRAIKKAMLLIVARFFTARQGDLCGKPKLSFIAEPELRT
jgi:hypothetical protein